MNTLQKCKICGRFLNISGFEIDHHEMSNAHQYWHIQCALKLIPDWLIERRSKSIDQTTDLGRLIFRNEIFAHARQFAIEKLTNIENRKEGWYWVKCGGEWEIAFWVKPKSVFGTRQFHWERITGFYTNDNAFEEIIETPIPNPTIK